MNKKTKKTFGVTTMTKKVVWISIILTIILWIVDILLNLLMSPRLMELPETAVGIYTESCKDVTIGLFATIVFYFLRAFMDTWNKARTGVDASDLNTEVAEMMEEAVKNTSKWDEL